MSRRAMLQRAQIQPRRVLVVDSMTRVSRAIVPTFFFMVRRALAFYLVESAMGWAMACQKM